jgi:hypothetical protein
VERVEGHYSNYSNRDPIELKPKKQEFDEAAEKNRNSYIKSCRFWI